MIEGKHGELTARSVCSPSCVQTIPISSVDATALPPRIPLVVWLRFKLLSAAA